MAVFPRPSSPRRVIADLKAFIATGDRDHRAPIAVIAILMPILIVAGFAHDADVKPPPPEMTFIPSWPADRTDAQIIAQQKIDEDARVARVQERQRQFQKLERQLGM
jgi:hypothetical protein